ncbi:MULTISPECIES: SRPBCC domain-containing protein [unclassified Isoptericola]|uniref:SRPBCC domain-containing protein n=1 Tax=unclassified Isoptericola TaxID=2623355 RepID=UPI00271377F7|nr:MULTISPECIES: SRPBCC domain-containing protein [unclassified Isoptericola]MDO8144816.1 SRPBCC domain-containing protein [Isoptericola sp. 178]MDO8152530.1 SRPBCC domain-containing protein [Isoptericola sp. b408]
MSVEPSLAPVECEVLVPCPPARAYRLFVDDLGTWWPLGTHSVFGAEGTVAVTDGRLVETGPDGATAVWGTITEAVEPEVLEFTWHPGADPDTATLVRVTFAAAGPGGTRVRLVHTGWQARPDGAAARAGYDRGWPGVLDALAAAA